MTYARFPWSCLPIVLSAIFVCSSSAFADDDTAEALFVRRVAPLLQEKCLACHGADTSKIEGGLDLRTRTGMLTGGDSESPAFISGKPDESPLYLAITRTHDDWSAMPPKEAEQLTGEQVGWIKTWIAAGAPWPDAARTKEILTANADKWSAEDGVTVKTSGGLSPEWTDRKYKPEGLWAYQPIVKPNTSTTNSAAIDELIAARLPADLPVAPSADRRTLIRRATYDLTGLPPSLEEIASFVNDPAPDDVAFARLVDRLLASPHYGERMAQHWLDVVRYADSSGFANDYERGNAWRYRDYVIRAFNNDKPYNQFVREQIAGDEIDPNDPEKLVAVGFLRMGPWELTGMEVAKIARQRFLDDVTNSVGETFLAHSLQCARCHDHKFDPVPTRDYYSIQAVFATTQLTERRAAFLDTENTGGFDERKYLERRRDEYQTILDHLDDTALAAAETWYAERKLDPQDWQAAVEQSQKQRGRGTVFNSARNVMLKNGVPEDQFPPRMLGCTPEQIGLERIARKGLERLAWEFDRYEPFALSVYNGPTPQVKTVNSPVRMPTRMTQGELEQTCILIGGDAFSAGQPVKPSTLSVVGIGEIPTETDGRRKAFAAWVTDEKNPLTPRVIANRVWMWHFGEAIAGNPNNFGSTGKRPTHPELLDWLAAALVEQKWSIKSLHRLIMNTDAYRRSAEHPDRERLAQLDPLGTSYAVFKPRRLSAEELRDSMLAVTGELNRTLGGIPVRPEINLEAALQPRQVMGTFAAAWTPNPQPEQRNRRSIYALKLRGLADPAMEVFNAPGPDFSCERREVSTVTPQVFSLLNSRSSANRSLALAARVMHERKDTDDDRWVIARCFELTLGHQPTEDELTASLTHWRAIQQIQSTVKPISHTQPLEVRRDAVEENTGEKFSFTEKLYSNADFVPDLQPTDVDAKTRALADVCLALFNSSEFSYVY